MNTEAIAKRLVELCRAGKYDEAQSELYGDDAVSIEPEGLPPGALGNAHGMAEIREKSRKFSESIEAVHGGSVSDALVAGNWFTLTMAMDVTMKGRGRFSMSEVCVYGVRDGKIVHEQFFYDVG